MFFGDLQTAFLIKAIACKRGIQHLADHTNSNFKLQKEP